MQICHDTQEELLKAMQIYGVMLQQGRAQCRLLISFALLVKDAFFLPFRQSRCVHKHVKLKFRCDRNSGI